ncbi:MAG: DUF167 domain-containing protein [Bacteroidetes bacterium]|jgi:hypothetical protein|nr:DUF167 domain-containing protein [Bacteroidota bacterium]
MPRVWVHARPGSRVEGVEVRSDGVWVVKVRPAAVDGKANVRLCEVLADHLGCRPSAVRVVSGTTARRKLVEIPSLPIDHPIR